MGYELHWTFRLKGIQSVYVRGSFLSSTHLANCMSMEFEIYYKNTKKEKTMNIINATLYFVNFIVKIWIFFLQDWYYRVFGFPEQKLQGELALVTGGGGGLGRLISLRLSKLGVDIVVWDIKQEGIFLIQYNYSYKSRISFSRMFTFKKKYMFNYMAWLIIRGWRCDSKCDIFYTYFEATWFFSLYEP